MLIKSDTKPGCTISVGYNKKKDEISIKVLKGEEEVTSASEEE